MLFTASEPTVVVILSAAVSVAASLLGGGCHAACCKRTIPFLCGNNESFVPVMEEHVC